MASVAQILEQLRDQNEASRKQWLNEKAELIRKCQDHEAKVTHITNALCEKHSELENQVKQTVEWKNRGVSMQESIDKQKQQIQTYELNFVDFQSEIEQSQQNSVLDRATISMQEQQIKSLLDKIELRKQNSFLDSATISVQEEQIKSLLDKIELSMMKRMDLRRTLEQINEENKILRLEAEKMNSTNIKLNATIAELRKEIADLRRRGVQTIEPVNGRIPPPSIPPRPPLAIPPTPPHPAIPSPPPLPPSCNHSPLSSSRPHRMETSSIAQRRRSSSASRSTGGSDLMAELREAHRRRNNRLGTKESAESQDAQDNPAPIALGEINHKESSVNVPDTEPVNGRIPPPAIPPRPSLAIPPTPPPPAIPSPPPLPPSCNHSSLSSSRPRRTEASPIAHRRRSSSASKAEHAAATAPSPASSDTLTLQFPSTGPHSSKSQSATASPVANRRPLNSPLLDELQQAVLRNRRGHVLGDDEHEEKVGNERHSWSSSSSC